MPDFPLPDRIRGALLGACISDALAMPVHWIYDRTALNEQYGRVTDYAAPQNPHPDSILHRSSYLSPGPKGEILHEQARYWGRKDIHYHQFLEPGENTLNLKLVKELIDCLNDLGDYDPDVWLDRYIEFMTTPGRHNDTYIEECHRHFFHCYGQGNPAQQCAKPDEKHIGGLAFMLPVLCRYIDDPARAMEQSLKQLALTHGGQKMREAGTVFGHLLLRIMRGEHIHEAVQREQHERPTPLLDHPFESLLPQSDDMVVELTFKTTCYVEHSLPLTLYLALKYNHDPEEALIVNTNLGGDNCYRGAVLGALFGADRGPEAFPARWISGLIAPPPDLSLPRSG